MYKYQQKANPHDRGYRTCASHTVPLTSEHTLAAPLGHSNLLGATDVRKHSTELITDYLASELNYLATHTLASIPSAKHTFASTAPHLPQDRKLKTSEQNQKLIYWQQGYRRRIT